MSTLRRPVLGPIVGHTTHQSCRLWISSDPFDAKEDAAERRTLGVVGLLDAEGKVYPGSIAYFRLHREFHRTGTFNLGMDVSLWTGEDERVKLVPFPLKPSTRYTVRLATLTVDDAMPNDVNVSSELIAARLPAPTVWAGDLSRPDGPWKEARFTTFPAEPASGAASKPLSFLLGSCRYPGLFWKQKLSDKIFEPMLEKHGDANLALMVGDQIYADMFNRIIPIGLADTYEEFQERYHTAFSSPNMRALLSRLPTYMILDDHEIEDNWVQNRIKDRKKRVLFNLAIGAYMSFQWSHGPRFADSYVHHRKLGGNDAHLKRMDSVRLFYDFSCAGYPFFVLDGRTQRFKDDVGGELQNNHLLGRPSQHPTQPSQLDRFCAWLRHMQEDRGNTPKFVVSASVFVPNAVTTTKGDKHKQEDDSWPAFPETRRAVLDCIVENKVQNVVFLSGDIHCANLARMTFTGAGKDLIAYSITSSAFYWPFPFADGEPADYVHDSRSARDGFKLSGNLGVMHYKAWAFTQADNFCRVDVDPKKHALSVRVFGTEGDPLATSKQNNKVNTNAETLHLARW